MTIKEVKWRLLDHFMIHNDDISTPKLDEAVKIMFDILTQAETRSGCWENGNEKCPICGESKFKNLDADIWADWKPPFCPNCGTDMRGE